MAGPARMHLRASPFVLAVALAVLVLCWLAAIHLREGSSLPGSRFDAAWAVKISAHHTPGRDAIAEAIALLGGPTFGILIDGALAVLLFVRRGWAVSATFVGAAALSEADVLTLKGISQRPSPGGGLYLGVLGSFPSGHTANAAVVVVSIGLLTGSLLVWTTGSAYVAVMGLDRTYLDAHWVTDTVAGALAGAAIAAACWYIARPPVVQRRRLLPTRALAIPDAVASSSAVAGVADDGHRQTHGRRVGGGLTAGRQAGS